MSRTILVVDDSMVSRIMLKTIIESNIPDAIIIEANSGEQALNQLDEDVRVDIALIDFNMPGMDGLELINQLKNRVNIPKRALLTANIQDEIRDKTTRAGVTFLNKPIVEDVVVGFLNN